MQDYEQPEKKPQAGKAGVKGIPKPATQSKVAQGSSRANQNAPQPRGGVKASSQPRGSAPASKQLLSSQNVRENPVPVASSRGGQKELADNTQHLNVQGKKNAALDDPKHKNFGKVPKQ